MFTITVVSQLRLPPSANVDEEDYMEWLHSGENRILNDYVWGDYRATAITDENGKAV